jgi:excisionase family DNA binding protein
MVEKLFTLEEAAEAFGTSARFPRRLVAQRRIRFVRVGKFVRIPESAIDEFVVEGTVDVVVRPRGRRAS